MDLEFLKYIPEENIKKWTKLTTYCYDIGCICKNCEYFPKEFKRKCKVKLQVLLLYRKFGNPKKEVENESKGNRGQKKSIKINTPK